MNAFFIVFNIYPIAPDVFLPNAYIVKKNADGKAGYIQQKATSETVPSFNLNLSTEILELIKLTEQLQEQLLAKKFNNNPKKRVSLNQLISSEQQVAKTIKGFIWKKMAEWLSGVYQSKFLLTYCLPRKEEAQAHKLYFHAQENRPELFFKLKEYGVLYTLKLFEKGRFIKIFEKFYSSIRVRSRQSKQA